MLVSTSFAPCTTKGNSRQTSNFLTGMRTHWGRTRLRNPKERPTRNGGLLITAETRNENCCLYFAMHGNWRLSQSRSNLLFQNGHEVSVAECVVLLFLAAEQLGQ
jgi:hypothetical protein